MDKAKINNKTPKWTLVFTLCNLQCDTFDHAPLVVSLVKHDENAKTNCGYKRKAVIKTTKCLTEYGKNMYFLPDINNMKVLLAIDIYNLRPQVLKFKNQTYSFPFHIEEDAIEKIYNVGKYIDEELKIKHCTSQPFRELLLLYCLYARIVDIMRVDNLRSYNISKDNIYCVYQDIRYLSNSLQAYKMRPIASFNID